MFDMENGSFDDRSVLDNHELPTGSMEDLTQFNVQLHPNARLYCQYPNQSPDLIIMPYSASVSLQIQILLLVQ